MDYNIDEMISKYSICTIKKFNKENFCKIITFLMNEKCDYIEDIISDYLDLFINFNYDTFVNKYNILNKKYNSNFLKYASVDMNLFEEFYYN